MHDCKVYFEPSDPMRRRLIWNPMTQYFAIKPSWFFFLRSNGQKTGINSSRYNFSDPQSVLGKLMLWMIEGEMFPYFHLSGRVDLCEVRQILASYVPHKSTPLLKLWLMVKWATYQQSARSFHNWGRRFCCNVSRYMYRGIHIRINRYMKEQQRRPLFTTWQNKSHHRRNNAYKSKQPFKVKQEK